MIKYKCVIREEMISDNRRSNAIVSLPSSLFPLFTRTELLDFFDEFLDIWLWDGEESVLFLPSTSWHEYDVWVTVNIGWTVPITHKMSSLIIILHAH